MMMEWKTMFGVSPLELSSSSPRQTIMADFLRMGLKATYSWPCVKRGRGRYSSTMSNVCPWALLMVIAKHGLMGNCFLTITKGKSESRRWKGILGRNTVVLSVPLPPPFLNLLLYSRTVAYCYTTTVAIPTAVCLITL